MVSVCCRIHCGDNRISMACCKACKHFLVPRTILLTYHLCFQGTSVYQEHVIRLKSLFNIPDSLYLKNGIIAQIVSIWSAFSQDTRFSLFKEWNRCLNRQYLVSLQSICVLNVLSTDFIFCERSKQLENLSGLIDPSGLQRYIFDLVKPLFQIPVKTENSAKIVILQIKIK